MTELLDMERLDKIAAEKQGEFADAKPYPHIVIDDFLPLELAESVLAEFDVTAEP